MMSSYALLHIIYVRLSIVFFRILSIIKMKFGQVLVQLVTNILDLFLTLFWRLDTS